MTKKPNRNNLLARIHLHHGYISLKDDESWVEFLQEHYKVSSCKDLSLSELSNLLDVLEGKADAKINRQYRPNANPEAITIKQEWTINKLWENKPLKWQSDFCFRTIGKRPLYLNSITIPEATKLINGLRNALRIK